jgi:hypothetical protein
MMGAPNEEAIAGHPLSDRGVEAFAAFEVKNSSWIRNLELMNSVHPITIGSDSWNTNVILFSHFRTPLSNASRTGSMLQSVLVRSSGPLSD